MALITMDSEEISGKFTSWCNNEPETTVLFLYFDRTIISG